MLWLNERTRVIGFIRQRMVEGLRQSQRLCLFAPLSPALSPLRGEGEAPGDLGVFVSARERRKESPSPFNGERAGVRGATDTEPSETPTHSPRLAGKDL